MFRYLFLNFSAIFATATGIYIPERTLAMSKMGVYHGSVNLLANNSSTNIWG